MSREIISYVRIDGPVSNLVDVDNKSISNGLTLLPVIYVTEQASHKLRLLHNDPAATPYSVAELSIYTGFDFGIAEDYAEGTTVPVRTQTGITVIEESWFNSDNIEQTGAVLVIPIDANTTELITILGDKPYVYKQPDVDTLEVNVGAELLCYTPTDTEPSLIVQYPFMFVNRRIKSETPPGTPGVDFLTPAQIEAAYIQLTGDNVTTGTVLDSADEIIVIDNVTGVAKKRPVSEVSLGSAVPPVQNEYVDIATMLLDQGNQSTDYIQQAGIEFYKKKTDATADISDYDLIGGGGSGSAPVQNRYADTATMIADQVSQTLDYIQKAGVEFYVRNSGTAVDITDYDLIGSDNMKTATYDPAGISEQLVGLTATQTLENKTLKSVVVEDYVDFTPQAGAIAHATGRFYYDENENCMVARNDISDVSLNVGEELWGRLSNDNAYDLPNGKVGYIKGAVGANLACDLADASSLDKSIRAFGLFTNTVIPGAQGYITRYGLVRDIDTSAFIIGDVLWVDPLNPGELTNEKPKAPYYPIRIGLCMYNHVSAGAVAVDTLAFNGSDTSVNIEGTLNGVVVESPNVEFYESGGNYHVEIRNDEDLTANLNFILDGMRYQLDTTTGSGPNGGATAQLVLGADAETLFENAIYIWLNGSTPELKVSTLSTPDENAPIGIASAFNYTRTVAEGVFKFRRFNDAPDNGVDDGFNRWIADAVRAKLGTTYSSGIAHTTTITSVPSVKISTTSGLARQMHNSAFTVQDGNSYFIYNDETNAVTYESVTDLADIVETAAGATLAVNGAYYRLKVYGMQNSTTGGDGATTDKLLVTRPLGYYGSAAEAIVDATNFDITPNDILTEGVIFPLYTIVVSRTGGGGGTWAEVETQDNRSRIVGGTGGGGASGAAGADELVKISATDTTTGYMDDKISLGTGLEKATLNPAGNEQIELSIADTAVTPGAYTSADITIDAQGRITTAANGSEASTGGYTPPSGTNAVTDTDPLTANTVSNTFAGSVDGTVTVPDTASNGDKYFLWASGSAKVLVELTTAGTPVVADVVNEWGVICIEYDTVSSGYNVVRTILDPLFDGSTLTTEHYHEISGQVAKTDDVNDTEGSIYAANGSGAVTKVPPAGALTYFGENDKGEGGAMHDLPISAQRYTFNTSTVEADPGANAVRFNNAVLGSVTEIYMSHEANQSLAIDKIISNLKNGDLLYANRPTDKFDAVLFEVTGTPTDNSTWYKIPVSTQSATGEFVIGDSMLFSFMFPASSGGGGSIELAVFQDQKSSGTEGGNATDDAYATRDMNTVVLNQISGASLSSNQVTLPSGTYLLSVRAPAFNCGRHKIKIDNISGQSFSDIIGSSAFVTTVTTDSFIEKAKLTLTASSTFDIKHFVDGAASNQDFGVATVNGDIEIYTQITVEKIG